MIVGCCENRTGADDRIAAATKTRTKVLIVFSRTS
jgi:hypothetical protein